MTQSQNEPEDKEKIARDLTRFWRQRLFQLVDDTLDTAERNGVTRMVSEKIFIELITVLAMHCHQSGVTKVDFMKACGATYSVIEKEKE